jgi:hypothetical protein
MVTCIVCKEDFDVAGSWSTGTGLLLDRAMDSDAICARCVRDATLHEFLREAWAYSPESIEALETIRIAGGKPKP